MKRKRIQGALVALALLIALLPTTASAAVVAETSTRTSVYATAHAGSPVFATLSAGTRVQVISHDDNWAQISLGGETGYVVMGDLIFFLPSEPTPSPAPTRPPHEKAETPGSNATITAANKGPVHVREHPSLEAGLINTFANGSRIRVLSQSGGWYYAQVGGNVGYIDGEFVTLDAGVSFDAGDADGYIDAMVDNPTDAEILHLRAQPSLESAILDEYHNGTYVKVLAIGLEWMHVVVEGKEGYMMSEFLRVTTPNATSERVIDTDGGMVTAYAEAGGDGIVAEIADGTVVNVLIPLENWSKVSFIEGGMVEIGYVENALLAEKVEAKG